MCYHLQKNMVIQTDEYAKSRWTNMLYIPEKNDSECADDLTLNTISNEMGMSLTIQ